MRKIGRSVRCNSSQALSVHRFDQTEQSPADAESNQSVKSTVCTPSPFPSKNPTKTELSRFLKRSIFPYSRAATSIKVLEWLCLVGYQLHCPGSCVYVYQYCFGLLNSIQYDHQKLPSLDFVAYIAHLAWLK